MKKKKKTISEKSARRWLARNKWNIAKFNIGQGSRKGSCFHRQLVLCRRSADDVRFRFFGNILDK